MKENKSLDINHSPYLFTSKPIPRYSDKYKDVLQRAEKSKQPPKQVTKPIFFYRIRSIGVGAFSFVYLVSQQSTGLFFAQKSIHKKSIKPQLITEIKLQLYLQNSNVVKMYHVYADQEYIHLIMDYAGDSLFTLIKNGYLPKVMDERMIVDILKQLINAVGYLHQKGLVHADIKLENILFLQGVFKLCDFGFSHQAIPQVYHQQHPSNSAYHSSHQTMQIKEIVGTLEYLDPQYVQGNHSQYQRDIWAIGIIAYELLQGKNPFESMAQNEKWSTILKINHIETSNLPISISKQMKAFLDATLCPIKQRATIRDLKTMEIFDKYPLNSSLQETESQINFVL